MSRHAGYAAPLGSYVAGSTPVHALDARVKIMLLAAACVACFGASSLAGIFDVCALLAVALAASRTSPREVLRGLRPAAIVLCFSLVANALILVGEPDIVIWGQVGLSVAGLRRGTLAVARIALMVGFVLVFSSTTMPPAIADALCSLLGPLGRLGVPVGDVSMAVSIALRFIPITSEEINRIRCAQQARGARLNEGGVLRGLRSWVRLLVPLLVSLFRRADELARAMCDRCYTGENRTSLQGRLCLRDKVVLVVGLALCVAACLA